MVGDGEARFEEAGEHLSPAVVRLARLIADGRIAEQKDRRGIISSGDFNRANGRARAVEFERQLLIPRPGLRRLLAVFEPDLAAASDLRGADVDRERPRLEFPRGRTDILDHQPPQLGFDRCLRLAPRIAQGDSHVVIALGQGDREEEWFVARDEVVTQGVTAPAINGGDGGARLEPVARRPAVDHRRQDLRVTRRDTARPEVETEARPAGPDQAAAERTIPEPSESLDYRGGVEFGARRGGVRVVFEEIERFYLFVPGFLVMLRHDLVEVNEICARGLRRLPGPFAVIVRRPDDPPVLPDIARDWRKDNRRRAF